MAGIQMTNVPYKSGPAAMTDLIGGQIDIMCDQTTNTTGQIQAGEVKAYAVTSAMDTFTASFGCATWTRQSSGA